MIASCAGCGFCKNPWKKKIEQQTTIPPPPPPEIKNEAAQKPKRAILSSLIREEMESLNFPSTLSKIVVVLMIYDIIVFENLRFRPSTCKQKAGDFKNLQLLPENAVDEG